MNYFKMDYFRIILNSKMNYSGIIINLEGFQYTDNFDEQKL